MELIAYLVMAHRRPQALRQLVEALQSPNCAAFVHIDRKSDIQPFVTELGDSVEFIDARVPVYWGGWSQVQATLNLIRHALADSRPFTHFVLLSGEDYPLVRTDTLIPYLVDMGLECINCTPMPSVELEKPLSRLLVRRLEGGFRNRRPKTLAIRLINKLLEYLPNRDISAVAQSYPPHCGSQWWMLSRAMVEACLRVADTEPQVVRLFRYSFCPDESFFQTVVAANCAHERIARAFTYTDWSVPNPPAVLADKHIDRVTKPNFRLDDAYGTAPCLFVRKFPPDQPALRKRVDDFARDRRLDPVADRPRGRMPHSEV